MIRQSQRRLGLRRDGPPLLKKVNGRPHAKSDDEKENDSPSPSTKRHRCDSNIAQMRFHLPEPLVNGLSTPQRKTSTSPSALKRKSSTSSTTDLKNDSDYDRGPVTASSEDDDESVADIPSSYSATSRMGRAPIKPAQQRTTKQRQAKGLPGSPARKKPAFKNIAPLFDEVEEGISRKAGKSRNGKLRPAFGKAAEAQREFKKALESQEKTKATGKFVRPPPLEPRPIPKSHKRKSSPSQDSNSEQSEDLFTGAAEYVDLPEQQGIDLATCAKLTRPRAKRKSNGQPANEHDDKPSSSAGSRFKEVHTLTQAIASMHPEEIEKEMRDHEAEEKEKAALAANLPDYMPCPMQCGKILPRIMLDTLSMHASIKEQQQFCHRHRVDDAEKEHKLEGYPDIDWRSFAQRLEDHYEDIQRFLDKPEKLHFRKAMIERVKSNKTRNLLQQLRRDGLDELGVGYYGPRGHDMMTSYISKTFAKNLDRLGKKDQVMSTQGIMAYVQEVLVLELAAMFIREDMNVPDVEARRMMSESAWVGDLLYPSEDAGAQAGKMSASRFGAGDDFR